MRVQRTLTGSSVSFALPHLNERTTLIVELNANVADTSRDITHLLLRLADIHSPDTPRGWQLRCRSCKYLGPWAAATLYATFLQAQLRDQRPKISLPVEPDALRAYCIFSGMSQAFAKGPPPNPDHPDCETIPLSRFSQANMNFPDGLVRLLQRHTDLDSESEDQLRTCIQEVIQNVEDHAASPIGGVMSARFFATSADVRVGIVDRGVGIGVKLREKYPDVTDSSVALQRVIEGGYSSRSRINNMGLGVSNLFALVKSAGGRMAVFTGDARAEVYPGASPTVVALPFSVPGTAVYFSLPLSIARTS